MRYLIVGLLMLSGALLSACQTGIPGESDFSGHEAYNPKAAQINVRLGLSYLQVKSMQRAKRKLIRALEQDPKSAQANGAMAYYLEVTENKPRAEAYYRKAIKLADEKGAALNNYGAFLCRQKQQAKAEQYFMRAVQVPTFVRSSEAYENAGLCALETPNLAKAQRYFKMAVAQDPKRRTSLYELTHIAVQQHRFALAKQTLKQYSQLGALDLAGAKLGLIIARKLGDPDQAATYAMMIQRIKSQAKAKAAKLDHATKEV